MIIKIILYVFCSSMGLVLLKAGTRAGFCLSFAKGMVSLRLNYIFIVGMIFYAASFLMSLVIMKDMNLSIFYPVSAGLAYMTVCLLSVVILHEKVQANQWMGMGIVLAGIIVMNIK